MRAVAIYEPWEGARGAKKAPDDAVVVLPEEKRAA
jgi:hypothetical protein